jgi:hypothetical protein
VTGRRSSVSPPRRNAFRTILSSTPTAKINQQLNRQNKPTRRCCFLLLIGWSIGSLSEIGAVAKVLPIVDNVGEQLERHARAAIDHRPTMRKQVVAECDRCVVGRRRIVIHRHAEQRIVDAAAARIAEQRVLHGHVGYVVDTHVGRTVGNRHVIQNDVLHTDQRNADDLRRGGCGRRRHCATNAHVSHHNTFTRVENDHSIAKIGIIALWISWCSKFDARCGRGLTSNCQICDCKSKFLVKMDTNETKSNYTNSNYTSSNLIIKVILFKRNCVCNSNSAAMYRKNQKSTF